MLVLVLCAVSGARAEKALVAAFPPESRESGIAQAVAGMLDLPLVEDEMPEALQTVCWLIPSMFFSVLRMC